MEWQTHGCPECRRATLVGMAESLRLVASGVGSTRLFICTKCGGLWEENLRLAKPLTKDEATKRYPDSRLE